MAIKQKTFNYYGTHILLPNNVKNITTILTTLTYY